jgi:DNA invertase Pin-like site-specific DNA recombinase
MQIEYHEKEKFMKVFAYVRTPADGKEYQRQLKAIADFCAASDYQIKKIYSESDPVELKNKHRSTFEGMLRDIRSNGVRTIVVESLKRLPVKECQREQLLVNLASNKIHVLVSDRGDEAMAEETSDPLCRAMIKMHAVFEELDRALMVTRLRMNEMADKGENKEVTSLRDEYPEAMEKMRRLRHQRRKIVRMTYQKIAEALNQRGFSGAGEIPIDDEKDDPSLVLRTDPLPEAMVSEAV